MSLRAGGGLLGVALIGGTVLGGLTLGGVSGSPAGADSVAPDLLERAEEAAAEESYAGTVLVEWRDGGKARQASVEVRCAAGVMQLGDHVVGSGAQRMVKGPGGWSTLWGRDVIALGPSPERKYDFAVKPGTTVAGRPTRLIEVRLDGDEHLRERIHLDAGTGLLLRRELVGRRGKAYRSVGFTRITAPEAPVVVPPSSEREPRPAVRFGAPFAAPEELGAGYRLVGSYQEAGHTLHLFYSDGLHGLSVFEQPGRITDRSSPAGGRRVEVGGHDVVAYSSAAGEAARWEGEGVVYTVVSDAPFSDVAAAVGDLPHASRDGRLRQLADVVVGLFRWR